MTVADAGIDQPDSEASSTSNAIRGVQIKKSKKPSKQKGQKKLKHKVDCDSIKGAALPWWLPPLIVGAIGLSFVAIKRLLAAVRRGQDVTVAIIKELFLSPSGSTQSISQPLPLANLKFAVSDVFDIEGLVTGYGSEVWSSSHGAANETAAVMALLQKAGAAGTVGTYVDRLNTGVICPSRGDDGAIPNACRSGHMTGGGCSGAAAVVAAGIVDFAIGVDEAGAVRVPAGCCGCYAIRPTRGSLPLQGTLHAARTISVVSLLAHSPALLMKVGSALQLPGGGLNSNVEVNRVIIAEDLFALCVGEHTAQLMSAVKKASAKWAGAGMVATANLQSFIRDAVPGLEMCGPKADGSVLEQARAAAEVMWWSETLSHHGQWLESHLQDLDEELRNQYNKACEFTEEEVQAAKGVMTEMYEGFRVALSKGTLILMPTTAGPPPKLSAPPHERRHWSELTLQLQSIATLMGAPQVVMPVHVAGQAPFSVSLLGLHKSDMRLLQVAVKLGPSLEKHMDTLIQAKEQPAQVKGGRGSRGGSGSSSERTAESTAAQEQAEAQRLSGNSAFKAGQFDVAISHYSKAIECQPQQAVYYSNRAMAYLKVMQFEQAKEDCDQALNIELNAKTLLRRGTARLGLNDVAGAENDFRQVLALEPNNRQARAELQNLKDMKVMMEGMA